MNETKNKIMIDALMPYLHKAAESDVMLAAAMRKPNKSEKELADYLVYHYTHLESGCVIADGNEVIELATKYYKDDTIVMPNLSSAKAHKETANKAEKSENQATQAKAKTKSAEPKKSGKAKIIPMADMFADL